MTARVFDNPSLGLKPTLFFDIEIPLEPFQFDGGIQRTKVRLDFIRLPVSDWRDVQGHEYRFPVNPKQGYIDGSVYLGNVHIPADVTLIRFGQLLDRVIVAELEIHFDLEVEGPRELGKVPVKWAVPLSLDAQELDAAVSSARGARAGQ